MLRNDRSNPDTDGDTIDDSVEVGNPENPAETDGDAIINALDEDSDGDGLLDKDEAGDDDLSTPSRNTEGDGPPDYLDTDSDNDSISDEVEALTPDDPADTDGDGKPNYQDTDSNENGIPDETEVDNPRNPMDSDSDGTPNYADKEIFGGVMPKGGGCGMGAMVDSAPASWAIILLALVMLLALRRRKI